MAEKTKGLAGLLAGNIIFRSLNIACTLLITFLLTRAMGAEGFGMLSLMIANAALLNLLTCFGAESGITYHYSSGSLTKPALTSIAHVIILLQLLALLIVQGVYHFYTGKFLLAESEAGMEPMLYGLLYFVSVVTIDKYQAFFNAAHQYNRPVRIVFGVNLLSVIVYAFCYFGVSGVAADTFALIFILASALQALLMAISFHVFTKQPLRFTFVRRFEWTMFFSYSFVVLITNIIQFLAYRIDYWLIDYYKGTQQLGYYSLSVRLGQLLWFLPLLMAGILFPRIAGNADAEEEAKWLSLVRISNAAFLVIAIIAMPASFWIIPFFAGEKFEESVIPFICLLPGLLFFCFNIIFAAWFAGRGMLKINLYGSVLCLVLVLTLDLLLIPGFGIKGAAIASSIAYTAAGIHHLCWFAFYKKQSVWSLVIANQNDWRIIKHYLGKYTGRE